MKIEVQNIYPLVAWSWDMPKNLDDPDSDEPDNANDSYGIRRRAPNKNAVDDVCGICRASYNGTCPNCKFPGTDCPLVLGRCNHNFHFHCIYQWLKTLTSKGLCPMCRQKFRLKPNATVNTDHLGAFKELAITTRARLISEGLFDEDEEGDDDSEYAYDNEEVQRDNRDYEHIWNNPSTEYEELTVGDMFNTRRYIDDEEEEDDEGY
ncbi:anaphase promoting complex subunit 11 NDAI_0A06520 [Naumovozyma dairenensis CBS 421]|uniref:Anaphase-promoting complex subunit 11 n=1 Tax=Naumovozyma dairenensis (strain ATCC 10597 / BCRC 20456 / CBS 421 / NBRC 0211 / NRRL Y-12639) TaxID=1071378 RepID=G0W4R8_NAUDC|nr:hypothetical protein NDAI_0A06520 [Naumovozyma dairenensis CBS 421]CCD22806.1 hypothetical protein NDAI_0A06520 [Naumovozyma dairenensis CBS 421]